jgi:hypothetical protein
MKKRSKHGQAVAGATPAVEPNPTEPVAPRTISFQPTDAVRDALEKARVKLGLRSRSTLINEALVLFLRPMFGKRAMEDEAATIAKAEARFGAERKAA